MVGFSGYLGNRSILFTKFLAIKRGLLLACEKGIKKLICYYDSMLAVDLVVKGVGKHHLYSCLVTNVRFLLHQEDWIVSLEHTFRGGNYCVDWLANASSFGGVDF